jgi:hypothetical protein
MWFSIESFERSEIWPSIILEILLEIAKKLVLNVFAFVVGVLENLLVPWQACSGLDFFAIFGLVLILSAAGSVVFTLLGVALWYAILMALIMAAVINQIACHGANYCENQE